MQEIFTRFSVRKFEDKPVEPDKIEQLMRATMAAPTAGNQRGWTFYIVRNKEVLEKLSEASKYARPAANAPQALVICWDVNKLRYDYMAQIDCALATENFWLELTHLGLGGVMLGIAPVEERMEKVSAALNLPENIKPFTIVPFGYPAENRAQKDRYEPERIQYID